MSDRDALVVMVPKRMASSGYVGYKVTVNPVLKVEQYPLLKPKDLFTTLAG